MTPSTEAGRRLSENRDNHGETCHVQDRSPGPCECTCGLDANILAIEAEAVASLTAENDRRRSTTTPPPSSFDYTSALAQLEQAQADWITAQEHEIVVMAQLEQERAKVAARDSEIENEQKAANSLSSDVTTLWHLLDESYAHVSSPDLRAQIGRTLDHASRIAADHDAKVARAAVEAERERLRYEIATKPGMTPTTTIEEDGTATFGLSPSGSEPHPADWLQRGPLLALLTPESDSKEAPCIFPGCVSTDRHSHGGFPGGYTNPADPTGPPIPFTTDPEPGVRDYNGALLSDSQEAPNE